MEAPATNNPADATALLSKAVYYQITHTLRGLLPPPVTDTPADAVHRDLAAVAHVASLLPANPDEANLAAQHVAASAQADECMRLARQYQDNLALYTKCVAQSASMMRESRCWRSALLRAQAERAKREADPVARDAARLVEHRALALMADAMASAGQSANAAPPPPTPNVDLVVEAEDYARLHRKRATLIRRFGCVPPKLNFGPLRPGLVHAIATGTTPILQALDEKPRRAATVPA